jgi:uncharacterized Zn-binding protein involved in type VI secretion
MSRPFITLGDRTSHGGTVISADYTTSIHGKYMARVGDLTTCPRKGCRGTFAIVTGADDMTGMGQAVARHGDKTACGATLIAGQVLATWSAESSGGASAEGVMSSVAPGAAALIAVEAPTICLECLAKAAASGQARVTRDQ